MGSRRMLTYTRMCLKKPKTMNIASIRRRLKFICLIMICAVLLCVFIMVFQTQHGPQESLILDGTQQAREQGNSHDENTFNRLDIRATINKEKPFGKAKYDLKSQLTNDLKGVRKVSLESEQTMPPRAEDKVISNKKVQRTLINSVKHAKYSEFEQALEFKKDSEFDQALEFKEESEFDQALEFKKDTEFDQELEFKKDNEFDQALEFKEDQFQNITEDGKYIVFNAYIDGPNKDWIRAIGFSKQLKPTVTLHCLFWDVNMNAVTMTTNVTIQILPFHTSERFKNAIFLCPIPVKNATGVTIEKTGPSGRHPPNLMKIRESRRANRTFTICLRPIHFRETAAYDIVEWVEYYRLMGVDYFMIYNFTSDSLTDKILNYYINSGIMEVVQWHVPDHVIPTIHYYELKKYRELHSAGQFAMLNDFLYRVYWSTEYVINVDLDEFIVLLDGSKSFRQLLNKYPSSCEYLFRNSLVSMNNGTTNESIAHMDLAIKYRLKTVLYMKRQDYVYKGFKTKYIARTNCSQVLWLHKVWEKRPPYNEVPALKGQHISPNPMKNKVVVNETSSIVFHYRKPFESTFFHRESRYIEDNRFQQFAKELIDRIKIVWGNISFG